MFRGLRECIFFRKGKHSLAESRKSQGPFKGPCMAQWRTMAGHCWFYCSNWPKIGQNKFDPFIFEEMWRFGLASRNHSHFYTLPGLRGKFFKAHLCVETPSSSQMYNEAYEYEWNKKNLDQLWVKLNKKGKFQRWADYDWMTICFQ